MIKQSTSRRPARVTAAILLGTLLVSATPVLAHPAGPGSIAQSVEALRVSMLKADRTGLDALLSPGLSFGHSNGLVQTKSGFMQAVLSRQEVFKSIRLVGQKSKLSGNTAVVRQTFVADILLKGKPISVKLGELQIWQSTKGRWQLIARQAFKA